MIDILITSKLRQDYLDNLIYLILKLLAFLIMKKKVSMNFIDRIINHKDIPKNQEPSSFRLNMTGNVFTRVREYRNIGQSLFKKVFSAFVSALRKLIDAVKGVLI